MNPAPHSKFPCGRVATGFANRRGFLRRIGAGFGSLALLDFFGAEGLFAAESPGSIIRGPHFAPKAKSVIWLFMEGGPSAVDTFDPKPELTKSHGQKPRPADEIAVLVQTIRPDR